MVLSRVCSNKGLCSGHMCFLVYTILSDSVQLALTKLNGPFAWIIEMSGAYSKYTHLHKWPTFSR